MRCYHCYADLTEETSKVAMVLDSHGDQRYVVACTEPCNEGE